MTGSAGRIWHRVADDVVVTWAGNDVDFDGDVVEAGSGTTTASDAVDAVRAFTSEQAAVCRRGLDAAAVDDRDTAVRALREIETAISDVIEGLLFGRPADRRRELDNALLYALTASIDGLVELGASVDSDD